MIVLDTSFLLAFHDEGDVNHTAARVSMSRLLDGAWGKGLLLELVFVDTLSILKRARPAGVAQQLGSDLLKARELDFVPASEHFRAVWTEFQTDFLSPLSFTSHAVAWTARQRAGGKVLTFDPALRESPGVIVEPGG